MKNLLTTLILLFAVQTINAQCTSNVPTIVIDLSANPDTSWVMYEVNAPNRLGQCCGAPTNQDCIRFEITLHPDAAGVFFDYDGAAAYGSLSWQLNCGTAYSLRDTICVTETGSFTLTFCKPGADNGNYSLISVPRPTFPDDQFVPRNCIQPVEVLGVTGNSVTWQSISPGTPGQYNSNLSCTSCLTPTFTPLSNSPNEIEYRVCGYPILDYCVGNVQFCDTVKFTIQDSLQLSVTPVQPEFCSGGSVLLTAQATGGDGIYNYIWYNNSLQVVGTGSTYLASTTGNFTCEVRDGNYESGYCDDFFESVTVVETMPPTINAGADQMLCATSPNATISGTFQNANNVIWSGGTGTFQNGNNSLNNIYIPSSADIDNGFALLTLSTTGVSGGCINASDQIQVFYVDTIETDLSDISLLCKYGTASINPTISGGIAPFTYNWTNDTLTATNTLGEGTYCLTILDANGCQATKCISLVAPPSMDVVMSSIPVSTDGGSDGTATANVSGGVGPYTYLWSNGGTSSTITNLSYGIYTVTITDANGCIRLGSVVVNEPRCNGFYVSTSATNVTCFNGSNGTANAVAFGGESPYTFQWDDPLNQTTANISFLSAGVYMVIVGDKNGCFAINTASVNEPDPIINTITQTNVTIQGGNNGQAQANVYGGVGGYSYLWSNGSATSSITNLIAGWYTVEISDANNCTLIDSVLISEPPCTDFYVMIGATPPLCYGLLTGSASLSIVNGVAPYSIAWSTGEMDVTNISNLPAGFHSVQVTDAIGCQAYQTYGVSEPSPISIGFNPTPSTCFGFDNGTIDASITGGTYPYYYFNWSNGATTEDLINMAPGNYYLTVVDQNGCQETDSTKLVEPDVLTATNVYDHVSCFNNSDAWIQIDVLGGTYPYVFSWSNGSSSQNLSGIDVGGYILNIYDANNCSLMNAASIIIEQPSMVEIQDIIVNCPIPGESSTLVSVVPTGGNAGYSVSYDGGITFNDYGTFSFLLPVDAGYDIVVKDTNNCMSNVTHIDIDSNILISAIDFNTCYVLGQTDETITLSILGGSVDYSISTDNGATFFPEGQLTCALPINNSYQLVAMDQKGCLSEPFSIVLPDILSQNTAVVSNYNGSEISCYNMADGEALSTPSGGTSPYIYQWSNGQTTAMAIGLSAGNYTVVIEDSNGCQITGNVSLTNPEEINTSVAVLSNYNGYGVSCYNAQNGNIAAQASGGVAPYSCLWNNNATTPSIMDLPSGNYSVVVTDMNGCSTTGSATISQPDSLAVELQLGDVSCNGGNDGYIDVSVNGGTQPYNYQWNTGDNSEDISTLSEGTYSLVLSDANGCLHTTDQMVIHPNSLDISYLSSPVSCNGSTDGSIDLTCNGGTMPFNHQWSNGSTSEDIDNLSSGAYQVVVTDANGCWTTITINIVQPKPMEIIENIVNPTCFEDGNGSIDVSVIGGTPTYSYTWSNGSDTPEINGLSAGNYTVTVEDENNCVGIYEFTLTQPNSLTVNLNSPLNFHEHNITYFGGSDGLIETTINGGTSPYDCSWSNNLSTNEQNNLSAGVYYVIVTDANGCKAMDSIKLTEPSLLELPTIFTPNADGDNDFFDIHGIDAYPNNELIVVNRWGNVVYEEEKYHNTWKGTHKNGEELPDGVYFVILKINTNEIEKNTYVHIKRH